jgi:hypothetical protein
MATGRIFWVLPAVALLFSGCEGIDFDPGFNAVSVRGSGKVVSEKREVRGIDEVRLEGTGDLSIRQGNEESLTIEAEDNILPKIRTSVEGRRLIIGVERGISIRPTSTIRYNLVVLQLSALNLSGSGRISAGPLQSADFRVQLPGSGTISLDQLNANSLRAEILGSGQIQVAGRVARQEVRISGSGDYKGKGLESQSADVSISGSGRSTLWVHDNLSADISGSGGISYYGNPNVEKSISGSGGIHSLGDHP